MNYTLTKAKAKELIENKLSHFFGVTTENASYEQYYRAVAMIISEMMGEGRAEFTNDAAIRILAEVVGLITAAF